MAAKITSLSIRYDTMERPGDGPYLVVTHTGQAHLDLEAHGTIAEIHALARQISRISREPRDSISETREEVPGPETP